MGPAGKLQTEAVYFCVLRSRSRKENKNEGSNRLLESTNKSQIGANEVEQP